MSRLVRRSLLALIAAGAMAVPLHADWYFYKPVNGALVLSGVIEDPDSDFVTICDDYYGVCDDVGEGDTCDQCHLRPAARPTASMGDRHLREFFPRAEVPVTAPTAFASGTLERQAGTLQWRGERGSVRFPTGARFIRTSNGRRLVVYPGRQAPVAIRGDAAAGPSDPPRVQVLR